MEFFKTKKMILFIISIILITICLVSINSRVNAKDETVYLDLQEFRQKELDSSPNETKTSEELAYKSLNDKIMWKISVRGSSSGGTIDKYRTIYCIKAGPGFGGDMGSMTSGTGTIKAYTKAFDYKNPGTVDSAYRTNILLSGDNYNRLIWVLEHCYIPTNSSNSQDQQRAKDFRANLLKEAGIPNSKITDNEIDIVQQLAIWHYTNNGDANYDRQDSFTFWVRKATESYANLSDKYASGWDREDDAQELFMYFIEKSVEEVNAGWKPSQTVTESPVTMAKINETKTVQYGNEYIIGPFSLTLTNSTVEYDLALALSTNISYRLLNSSKNDVTNSGIKSLVGQNFYIAIPSSTNLTGLKLNLTSTVNQTNITYRSVENGTLNGVSEQPVVELTREQKQMVVPVDIPTLSVFDLALRKSITKVGTNAQSRLPNVVTTTLNNPDTTAKYNHSKEPVTVQPSQEIEYTLTIYNEGQVNGYAKEVVDYLPAGITFVQGIDTDGKWNISSSNESSGITKLTITNIEAHPTILNAYTGSGTPNSITIKLKCKVSAQSQGTAQTLTNIAEITKHSDEFGNETIVDRDSQPNNFPSDNKNNSYSGNGKDGDYVKGMQDDDDFEKIVIPAAKGSFSLQLLKVNNVNNNPLQGAKFRVKLSGTSQEYTNLVTESNGIVTISNIPITSAGTSVYEIIEEEAPQGYNKLINVLKIQVVTVLQGSEYVVQSTSITEGEVAGAKAELVDNKTVKVTIPNEQITGKFNLKIVKYDKDDQGKKLAGAIFEITKPDNSKETLTTIADGSVTLSDLDIPGVGTYTYTIKETQAPTGYEKIIEEIQVKITTEIKDGKYVVKSTEIVSNPQSVDGILSTVGDNEVQIDVPNTKIGFGINLELLKVDYSNNTLKLPGAIFEVTMPDNTKQNLTIGEDGTAKLQNIKIEKEGTYTFTIKEIQAPSTYIPFKETYTLTVKVGLVNDEYVIQEQTITSSKTQAEEGKVTSEATSELNGTVTIKVTLENKQFDLALRKFISKIGDKEYNRAPVPNTENLNKLVDGKKVTGAEYVHPKDSVKVKENDEIIYTIRVYNEGEIDGYASEVVDYLPEELEFIKDDELNLKYGWTYDDSDVDEQGRVRRIKTNYTAQNGKLDVKTAERPNGTLIKAYNSETKSLDYIDLQVKCLVRSNIKSNKNLTNIAEITNTTDYEGTKVTDRDSTEDSLTKSNSKPEDKNPEDNLPSDEQLPGYKDDEVKEGKEYIPGQQDDDDFEKVVVQEFDLALRKFIAKVNNKDVEPSREPQVDVSGLVDGTSTTAVKESVKSPVRVKKGDTVLYTIRVYNEGNVNAYVGEITDYLPAGLEYIEDSRINTENGWTNPSGDGKTIVTRKHENTLLNAFDGEKLKYLDVQVECKVVALNKATDLKNIAEITEQSDEEGNKDVEDRDSTPDNLTDDQKEHYNPENPEEGKGYEDDDDFEDLELQEFDLSLRKFITKVNNKDVEPSREPKVDVSGLVDGSSTTAIKEHTKEPVEVYTNDIIVYTIRVYNEGDINAYVGEITDYIPEGLEFIEDSSVNKENGWKNPSGDDKTIVTRKHENTLLNAFNGEELAYLDVQVECKVIAKKASESLKNIAEITEHSDEDGNKDIEDRDSTPDDLTDEQKEHYDPENPEKGKGYEDDDDSEDAVIKERKFDLSLRKFITAVDGKEIEDRIPKFKIDEDGNYVYEHTKEPVEVENGNIIIYTLRVYNEGDMAGFAEEVKDNIPDGLVYLPEDETNIEYRWKMLDEDGNETENVEEAVAIVTDYLSKAQGEEAKRDNLLLPFDSETMEEPDYRDVKIAFKIEEPSTSDRVIINEAQISDDADEDGDDVDDDDSTPDKWEDGDDDQDIEKVVVKYFDLSLRKWVSQAILVVDGKQTIIDTGHKPEDDPESTVKIELVESKLSRTVLKFKYKIRVTNEGEIAGSATEISEYIPQGLRFVAADNPKWKEVDGKVVTDQLKDVILEPGESADVEILLTWINSKQNFGQMVNVAEISDDWNPSNTPDIDSTPNNEKPEEDDIDDAPVMPSIKTGAEITYIGLILGSLVIIAGGLILIKKYVF